MCASPPIALIGCRVLEKEIAALLRDSRHVVSREFFEIGLHDQPGVLRGRLAAAIARAEANPAVESVVLVYGLCGLALAQLAPARCRLVVARAHDCVALFLGSKERYAACLRAQPGTYWYSPGWNRDRRVAGPEREAYLRERYTAQFGSEDAEALLEMERATFGHYTTAAHTDLGLPDDEPHRRYTQQCAQWLGWRYEHHAGDPRLLHDLLHGPWDDERFLVVHPGQRIAHTADERIIGAVPA